MTEDASAAKQLPDKKYDKTRHQTNGKLQDTGMDKDDIGRKNLVPRIQRLTWSPWTVYKATKISDGKILQSGDMSLPFLLGHRIIQLCLAWLYNSDTSLH